MGAIALQRVLLRVEGSLRPSKQSWAGDFETMNTTFESGLRPGALKGKEDVDAVGKVITVEGQRACHHSMIKSLHI